MKYAKLTSEHRLLNPNFNLFQGFNNHSLPMIPKSIPLSLYISRDTSAVCWSSLQSSQIQRVHTEFSLPLFLMVFPSQSFSYQKYQKQKSEHLSFISQI